VVENLENAPNLTVLDLYNNKIKELPLCVYKMQELKTLGIANNDLNAIDPYLGNMVNLVRVSIEGNPPRSIESNMRSAGAAQLKKYLKDKLSDEKVEEGEQAYAHAKGLPGASGQQDPWAMMLREFI